MKNQAQLIAYVDRLPGGTFRDLQQWLNGPLRGAFGGVHVLPFFHRIDGADAGFDPIDHTQVDRRVGTWADVAALAADLEVTADLIVNHVSRHSPRFQDYDAHGDDSPSAGMFLTYARVFPQGARDADLLALHTIRPELPFTVHDTARGERVLLWTTFSSDQIDIDVTHPAGRRYLADVLASLHDAGITTIRLDAVGFTVKKAGTSCFMIPETFAFIDELTAQAHALGIDVLVEVHGHPDDQIAVARHVDWVYDFALPPLVLHTLYTRNTAALTRWLSIRPTNAVTVLDTHDGIGVQDVDRDRGRPDADPLLPRAAIARLIDTIDERSRGESRRASGAAARNLDASQVNCTFYDALGRRDDEYLIARAIQCFVPGIPQIYYVGLLAGANDMDLFRRTQVGRDVNRRYYTATDLQHALGRPVVQSLLALLRLRNSHPAFVGTFEASATTPDRLAFTWTRGADVARLDVDLTAMTASVTGSDAGGGATAWRAPLEAQA
ncbi:MAG TPA: sucrose phosphorylase [Vicinamibacterales bacterium]|nr:sucrose phosphorylase [Vicinamibacterales bacterium]